MTFPQESSPTFGTAASLHSSELPDREAYLSLASSPLGPGRSELIWFENLPINTTHEPPETPLPSQSHYCSQLGSASINIADHQSTRRHPRYPSRPPAASPAHAIHCLYLPSHVRTSASEHVIRDVDPVESLSTLSHYNHRAPGETGSIRRQVRSAFLLYL